MSGLKSPIFPRQLCVTNFMQCPCYGKSWGGDNHRTRKTPWLKLIPRDPTRSRSFFGDSLLIRRFPLVAWWLIKRTLRLIGRWFEKGKAI